MKQHGIQTRTGPRAAPVVLAALMPLVPLMSLTIGGASCVSTYGSGAVEISLDTPIPVYVGDEGPFPFGFDTGQSTPCIVTRSLAERLGLEIVGQSPIDDGSGRNVLSVDLVDVPALTIGGVTFPPSVGVVLDLPQDGGVLGFPLFAGELLTIEARTLRFELGELPEPDGETVLPFTMPQGIPVVEIELAGLRTSAVIDTANPRFLSLPAAMIDDLALDGEPVVVGRMATLFNEFDLLEATLDGDLVIGGHRFPRPRLDFNEVLPDANVGSGLLEAFAVTFDQANGRLRLLESSFGPRGVSLAD